MTKIHIGYAGKHKVEIDLDILLRTRLLIQANSGGGKSYLLRRLCEQAFGKVQIIIIDPEGEFASLREKYDYVLVGRGGETPADVRSAALVAHKLLELNASAVCDLYEMKASQRHQWVSVFLDAMIDAPKELWHPVLVIVDEAHMITTQGFNALLKIVEEPPEHLIFVFATTEPEKVLPTIRSRTHHYPFRLLPPPVMRGLLEKICTQENVPVEDAVYPLVIRAGGGSPRDSLSVMDQLLAGAGEEGVTYSRALALLGVTDVSLIDDVVDESGFDTGAKA